MKHLMTAAVLILLVTGCASARNKNLIKFREITKDVCIDNKHEVKLAQALYKAMVIDN